MMQAIVPPEITSELTQILSNLVLGDNDIRENAEKAVNDRLAQAPDMYLTALAQFAITADTEVMRTFALVLLRRLLFRPAPASVSPVSEPESPASVPRSSPGFPAPRLALYDHLASQTLTTLENLLLHSLSHEPASKVRRNTVDTACDVANQAMARGRPWHALQSQAFSMTQEPGKEGSHGSVTRLSAYKVFAGAPNLVLDLQTQGVLEVYQRGLTDVDVDVRHAALQASVTYFSSADPSQLALSLPLLHPMLGTLPPLAQRLNETSTTVQEAANANHLSRFFSILTPLASSYPLIFAPHLSGLMQFLPPLIIPPSDCGPTPTVKRPFPPSFGPGNDDVPIESPHPEAFPLSNKNGNGAMHGGAEDEGDDQEARQNLRLATLEFMISLSEAKPGMVKKQSGWVEIIVRSCLEAMGEFDVGEGDGDGLKAWLNDDPSTSSSSEMDSTPALYEQSLDRLACALGGRALLPPAFQSIPSMLASYDWRMRHAGLMAIASIAEGTGKVMQNELEKIVDLVTPMFRDNHPRVRYAACQCVGQLCTDLEEIIQEKHHQQLFSVLIPTLEDPEPRVHTHAAAALINFCEGVERDTLLPYMDPIVERLLKLLNPEMAGGTVKQYVQEQAITTLAMVADASESGFVKHYASIMPLLLNVLRNADGPEYKKLRVKVMECAGLIAIAVGRDVFRPDSVTLVEQLVRIQKSPIDPSDTLLNHYLISTWAKVCQAMGPEFEPYLPLVMPSLLSTARAKADVSVYDEEANKLSEREGWETVVMDGQKLGIRTSAIEEKCQAFETLVTYCSTVGADQFAPYLTPCLEATLPGLKFHFHEGVREASALLIPMLLAAGKASGTLTNEMVTAVFTHLINCVNTEQDASFLGSLYRCFTESVGVIGGAQSLPPEYNEGIIEATKRQLQSLADRRRGRANRAAAAAAASANARVGENVDHMSGAVVGVTEDKEEMVLLEEIEEFALEDIGKMLLAMDPNHPLLVAVSSVRDLGVHSWNDEDDEEK